MKKHFKALAKIFLPVVVASTTMVSCGLILSSCVKTSDGTISTSIKIEDQSPDTNEVTSGDALMLYVNVVSSKPIKYQWYVDKNDNNGWTSIQGATESSYNIASSLTQDITTATTWKYKAEIYDPDNSNVKVTSNTYSVNIKPQSTTPDPSPEPTPPSNPDSSSTAITSSSIKLNNVGQLLPSQYLKSLSDSAINTTLITQGFDTTKITNVSYTASEFNDQAGTLSILMSYTENSSTKSYTFTFTDLLKLENSGYHFEFEKANGILNLSAQEISEKVINSNASFQSFVTELGNSDINFKFRYKGIELPLDYLSLNSVSISGFNTSWFTNNKKVILTFTLQSPKINYYTKTANGSIVSNTFDYPSNLSKQTTMEFYSASDYLLNKITNNSSYTSTKYSGYYFYDITKNNAEESQLLISDTGWLGNVTTELTYDGTKYVYQPLLNTSGITSAGNGSLSINLTMEYQTGTSTNINSQTTKDVTVTGFKSYDQDSLFSNTNDVDGKFSLGCDASSYDNNISRLKVRKDAIIAKIDAMEASATSVSFTTTEVPAAIMNGLISNVMCKFSGEQLIGSTNKNYWSNDVTAIGGYYINPENTTLRYNKTDDVFQLVVSNFSISGVGINSENYATNTDDMIINITSPGASLEKLRATTTV